MKYYLSQKLNFGLSTVEILIAVFILSLIGVAVFAFQSNVFSLNTILSNSLISQDETRLALRRMTAEIRALSPSSIGAYPIAETNSNSFIFYSDIDNDQLKERIRYFLDGTILKKGIIKPAGIPLTYNPANEIVSEMVHNITNGATPIFTYYNKDYDGTTSPLPEPIDLLAVRLVKITVIIDKNPNQLPGPMTFTTQVSMRNLKDNL